MRRLAVTVLGCVLAACARETPPRPKYVAENPPTFEAFLGKPLTVEVVDQSAAFGNNPGVIEAATASVEAQLRTHGVTVSDSAETRLVLAVVNSGGPATSDEAAQQCVTVVGSVQRQSARFMPTAETRVRRCAGRGVQNIVGDPVANAVIAGAILGIEALKHQPQYKKDQTQALGDAFDDVLARIDAQLRFGARSSDQ